MKGSAAAVVSLSWNLLKCAPFAARRLALPFPASPQLLLSLELYVLGPYCRRQVAAASPAAHLALTAAMGAAAAALLAPQSILLTSSLACAVVFVTFVCPWWLVRIHKFKACLNGPWDEAVPALSREVRRQLSARRRRLRPP